MAFELSYAGVGLPVVTDEARERVEQLLTTLDLRDIQPPSRWPGKNLAGIAWNDPVKERPFRLGQLFWPSGASRWAVGRFLASHYQVNQILGVVQPSGGSPPVPKPLILQAESAGVTGKVTCAKMYLLPPRPLAGLLTTPILPFVGTPPVTGPADLYLLTVVDIRYFWQYAQASAGTGTTDTPEVWSDLIGTTLAGELAVSLSAGSVDAVYGSVEPDSAFWTNRENAALMLDAALANTGRVLAANYDGTFTVQKIADARGTVKTERDKWKATRTGGGVVLNLDGAATDHLRDLILPEKVTVTFPQWVDDTGYYKASPNYRGWALDSYGTVKAYDTSTTTLTGFSGTSPMPGWIKVFHDTAKARYTSSPPSGSPSNDTDLTNLAKQIAQDYCDSLKARLDEIYPGVTPWTPDGVNDVTFLYATDHAWTRVQGPPLNAGVTELQHSLGPLEVPETTAGVEFVRITSWACKDHAGITACNGGPSPDCHYSGVIVSKDCAGWHNTSKTVWVIPTLENMLTPVAGVGGAPPTLIVVDGNTIVMAKDFGYTYAPDNGGTTPPHPNNGESRPVWGSDFYAAGQAIGCADGAQTLKLGGES
jgi:hypothetical protein